MFIDLLVQCPMVLENKMKLLLQAGISTDTSEHRYDIMAGHEVSNAITAVETMLYFAGASTGAIRTGVDLNIDLKCCF